MPFEGVRHAGGQFLLRHLEYMSQSHDITLLVPESEDLRAVGHRPPDWLAAVVPSLELDARGPSQVLIDALYRRLMGVPPAPARPSLRAVRRAGLMQLASEADVVELHWAEYARFATELRQAGIRTPVSIVEHDVDIDAYVLRVRDQLVRYRKVLAVATAPIVRRWEVKGLGDADLVLVFKAADEQVLRRVGIATPVQVLAPWTQPPPTGLERRPHSALFTGAMWRRENAEGARWFLERVWPRVREKLPDATLVLAGAGADVDLRTAARSIPGVEVTGDVPDLLPYYSKASVFVAPMFAAGGLKFKVAQAMRSGLPVVATTVAAQGVAEHAPTGVLWSVSDDPLVQAEAVLAAFQDPAAATRVGRRAAAWADHWWSFERSTDAVLSEYAALVERG